MNKWEETRLRNLERKECFEELNEVEMKHLLRLMSKKAAEKANHQEFHPVENFKNAQPARRPSPTT